MTSQKTFETDRLLLRLICTEDAEFILELFHTPKWLKYIGDRNVSTIAETVAYIQSKMLPQIERLGYGSFMVIRKIDLKKIGTCGLYDRDGLDGLDIGFAFLPEFEGQGYAFEAVDRIKNAAFEDFGLNELVAITTKENLSSQKLLEKLGLNLVGTTLIPNDEEELLLYRIKKAG
ncbi:MAG TPA: GNAT family N-acetyltransferase [Saprospiraceae bacterium]|nr:GNAT family N-acetyltransferase [Saprospiraceae bacterium]HQW55082.1 GNAT family N-acetyltransferase [Saprospiraceae bacterium]